MEHSAERQHASELPTGTLLRVIYTVMVEKEEQGMAEAGFDDVHAAHFALLLRLSTLPDGSRATDLAAWTRITKPSMNYLLDYLEERGYIERFPDSQDKRAQKVHLTLRGKDAAQAIRMLNLQVEKSWTRQIGEQHVELFKHILRDLVASVHEWEAST